jgi:hypothetical protein
MEFRRTDGHLTSIDIDTLEQKQQLLPWQERGLSYTASGYGSKIPTSRMVKVDNRWRRVYCTIYSNIGTCWFIQDNQKVIVR